VSLAERLIEAREQLEVRETDVEALERLIGEAKAGLLRELVEDWGRELAAEEMGELRYRGTPLGREHEIRAEVLRGVLEDAELLGVERRRR